MKQTDENCPESWFLPGKAAVFNSFHHLNYIDLVSLRRKRTCPSDEAFDCKRVAHFWRETDGWMAVTLRIGFPTFAAQDWPNQMLWYYPPVSTNVAMADPLEIPYEWTSKWESHLVNLIIKERFSIAMFVYRKVRQNKTWLVVWNIFYFPIYWVANHPNWLSYFSEGWLNHQPEFYGLALNCLIFEPSRVKTADCESTDQQHNNSSSHPKTIWEHKSKMFVWMVYDDVVLQQNDDDYYHCYCYF